MIVPALGLAPFGWHAAVLLAILAVVAALMGLATFAQRDLWPFSHYPMFGKATEADAVTFFVLRFHLADGRIGGLTGRAAVLADQFHREFARLRDSGAPTSAAMDEVVWRYWREAGGLDERFASATRVEVAMRIGRIVRGGEILLLASVVHSTASGDRSARP